ncbi:MAG: hypothetical protein LBR31_08680 [Desulfovibrio sp.]|jgi:hypothetical protein|nr:hypothetical protein [Desulfovibrio sp.]
MRAQAHFTIKRGRIALDLRVLRQGTDAQCLLSGGDAHIGAAALAWLEADGTQSRLACRPGHREDEIALHMAQRLALGLGCAVCVSAGIHFDGITREEIRLVEEMAETLGGQCLEFFSGGLPA